MISLPPFSDGILQDGVPFRQACSPLIQLFFGFASDIDQTNTYRDIRDGNWLSRAEQADGVEGGEVAWGADRTDVAVKYIL